VDAIIAAKEEEERKFAEARKNYKNIDDEDDVAVF
jgi:hypothetical protein